MNRSSINICGLGPGNPLYILPIVHQIADQSDTLIGGERHLLNFNTKGKEVFVLKNNLDDVISLCKNRGAKKICLVVSGDTGFYSMLSFMKRHFPLEELNMIPGISSFQYLFARVGLSYENAKLLSLHGREMDVVNEVKNNELVFCLTDKKLSWKYIAEQLVTNDLGFCLMYIGNNLSYPNETIIEAKADELIERKGDFELCSVIIKRENLTNHIDT